MDLVKELFANILIFFSKPLLAIVYFLFGIKIEDRLTQGFIGVIFLIFIYFFIIYIARAKKSQRSLENELKQIKNIQDDDEILPDNLNEFEGISTNCSLFTRILMPYKLSEKQDDKLYATQDVESTVDEIWSPEILQSRMFPTVSAILTGLGVLGTFVGLLIGLKGLDLSGNMEELQGQIQRVADGASVAFMTSVCGVFLSLVFTFAEKYYSGRIAGTLRKLQKQLALLFPPLPIMQVFADMKTATKESENILGGLAVQIGDQMQQRLAPITQEIITQLARSIKQAKDLIAGAVTQSGADTRARIDANTQQITGAVRQSGEATQSAIVESAQTVSGAVTQSGVETRARIDANSQQITGAVRQSGEATQSAIVENAQTVSGAVTQSGRDTQAAIGENARQITVAVGNVETGISRTLENGLNGIPKAVQNGIAVAISENLAPAIGRIADASEGLAERQAAGAEGALQGLIEQFMQSMGTEGAKQQQALTQTTNDLNNAFTNFMGELKGFIQSFQSEQQRIISGISENINNISSGMGLFLTNLKQYHNGITTEQDTRAKNMEERMNGVLQSQELSLQQWAAIISNNVTATERLLNQGNALQNKIQEGKTLLDELASAIQSASGSLAQASVHLEGFGNSISGSIDRGTGAVERAVGVVEGIEKRQKDATEKLDGVIGQMSEVSSSLEGVHSGFATVGETLSGAANTAKEGFETAKEGFVELSRQYPEFQKTLRSFVEEIQKQNKKHIDDLDERLKILLEKYADDVNKQVADRMNKWNEQTQEFCGSMQSVVGNMLLLAQEIDIKRKKG